MRKDIDLSVRLGDLVLENPFIVGSGPTARNLEQLKQAEDAGWAAASLKLAIHPTPYISLPPRYRWLKGSRMHMFTAETRLTQAASLKLLEEGRRQLEHLVLIPNITYDGGDEEGWVRMAKDFENAGARVIELNMCCPNMSYNVKVTGSDTEKETGASLGSDLIRLPRVLQAVTNEVKVPVIVKLTPEGGAVAAAADLCIRAGARAVGSTGNRLGLADIDIYHPRESLYRLQGNNTLSCLSGPYLRPLALRDTYEIRKRLGSGPFLLGSGGISDAESAIRQIMAGADALWVCTETILRGFHWLRKTLDELKAFMKDAGYTRPGDFRDAFHGNIRPAAELEIHEGYAEVLPGRCTSCGRCWDLGHCGAITHPDGVTVIDRDACRGCSTCVDVCPRGAIVMIRNDG